MSTLVIFIFRIGLLALLWLGILFALRIMARDTRTLAGPAANIPKRASRTSGAASHSKMSHKQGVRQLVAVSGAMTGSSLEIASLDEVVLGRSSDCDFVVNDDFASARHARLFRRGNDWYVEDLESRNGTHINGVRIDQPERVGLESDITIGRTIVRLMP